MYGKNIAGQFRWLQQQLEAADRAGRPAAFVVASAPVLMPPALAFGQALQVSDEPGLQEELGSLFVSRAERRGTDSEHWLADGSFVRLRRVFESLARTRRALKSVVFLSCDVHFSYNMRAQLLDENKETIAFPQRVQLVSSALRNEIGRRPTFKLRKVAEPSSDALTDEGAAAPEAVPLLTRFRLAFARWIANPFTPNSKLLGAEHMMGGLRGIDNLRQTMLVDNSVAVVDAWFVQPGDPNFAAGEFVLRERHLVNGLTPLAPAQPRPPANPFAFGPPNPFKEPAATGIPEFWYQTGKNGSVMTLPPFIGDGRTRP